MRYIIRDCDDDSGEPVETHFHVWDYPFEQERLIGDLGLAKKIPYGGPVNIFQHGSRERDNMKWYGRTDLWNWVRVRRACETRWDYGYDLMVAGIEKIQEKQLRAPRSLSRRPCYNTDGGDFDYNRYTGGAEDFWVGPRRRDLVGQQAVTIVVSVGANCNVEYDRMVWGPIAAVVAAAALEMAGFCVQIDMAGHVARLANTGNKSVNAVNVVTLKTPEQPLDIEQLANATSPWWFRTIGFTNFYLYKGVKPVETLGTSVGVGEEQLKWVNPDDQRIYVTGVWN